MSGPYDKINSVLLISENQFSLISEQYIVMEYLDAGSLYSYVVKQKQDSKHISITQFIKISLDIAKVSTSTT